MQVATAENHKLPNTFQHHKVYDARMWQPFSAAAEGFHLQRTWQYTRLQYTRLQTLYSVLQNLPEQQGGQTHCSGSRLRCTCSSRSATKTVKTAASLRSIQCESTVQRRKHPSPTTVQALLDDIMAASRQSHLAHCLDAGYTAAAA